MESRYVPWRPSDPPGPARFGLDADSWRRLLILHAEVADGQRNEWPEGWAPPRMYLIRHLVREGKIHEG